MATRPSQLGHHRGLISSDVPLTDRWQRSGMSGHFSVKVISTCTCTSTALPSLVPGLNRHCSSASIADPSNTSAGNASGALQRNPGMAAERASLISSSGIAPALVSERNSYLGKQGDGASVRSGLLGGGHGRNDSFTNSLGGGYPNTAALSSPLASPLFGAGPGTGAGPQGRNSRQSSAWGENADDNDDGIKEME